MQQRVCVHCEQKLATPHTQDRYLEFEISMRINNKSSINFIIIFLSFFVIGCFGIPRKVIITPTLEILDQQTVSWLGDTVSKDQLDNTLQKYYRRTNSAVKKTIQVRLKSSAESSTTQKVKEILDKNKLPNIKHTVTKES